MPRDLKRLYTTKTTDPRWLMKRQMRLMSIAQQQLAEKAKKREAFTNRDIQNMCGLAHTLAKLVKMAEDDDLEVLRQMQGMSDEELLVELKKKLKGYNDNLSEVEKDVHISPKKYVNLDRLTYEPPDGEDTEENKTE